MYVQDGGPTQRGNAEQPQAGNKAKWRGVEGVAIKKYVLDVLRHGSVAVDGVVFHRIL